MAYNSDCCFLTLTYADPEINTFGSIPSLSKRDLQLFFKRLRKYYKGQKISYFACGEYGEKTSRPHYHILLFGIPMLKLDLKKMYTHLYSETIKDKIWTYGNNSVGNVEKRSIYYVTGYILKNKQNHAELHHREPEFNLVSKNFGLEMLLDRWDMYFEKYIKRESIPKYYNRIIKQITGIDNSQTLFDGLTQDALKIYKHRGTKGVAEYKTAMKEAIESSLQKEKDSETLEKLISRRTL